MDSTPLPVMSDESGRFIHWKGQMWKQMKSRSADSYSDAHRLRRKNYMKSYRAKKKERATVQTDTRAEDIPIVTSVTVL